MKDTEGKTKGRQSKGVNVSLDPEMRAWFEQRVESLKRFDAPVRINSNSHYVQELIRRDMMLDLLGGGFLIPKTNTQASTDTFAADKSNTEAQLQNQKRKRSRRQGSGAPQQ